jgi:hypothetical protein
MYGGGALLIREITRRFGRGWPTIFALALAYAIVEEAFLDQTLFNPNYLGLNLHLLEHGYIPALGIGAWWTVFVLTLHTVWSISTSIALAEALAPDRSTTPWLGRIGLAVASVLFLLGAGAVTLISIRQDHSHFMASVPQFISAGVIAMTLIAAAFRLPRTAAPILAGTVPNPWLVGAAALAAGSLFLVVPPDWGWWAFAACLALDLGAIVAIWAWSRHSGWNGSHRLALAAGAVLAYAWHAFVQTPVVPGTAGSTRIGNAVFALGAVILISCAARKLPVNADFVGE